MPSRREQIRMSDEEARAFLDEERTVTCATLGRDGWPHLMPLWYVVRDSGPDGGAEIWAWTFAKSQKTRNLERDPRATLQVEAGTEYHLLRGLMLECETEILRDPEAVLGVGLDVFARYAGGAEGELADEVREMVARQAAKRVAFRFRERRRVSWDHRKLGGVY
jgi:PPOX class probable F420-dependent enzyme